MSESNDSLPPCPICGGQPEIKLSTERPVGWLLICAGGNNDGAHAVSASAPLKSSAIAIWSRRAPRLENMQEPGT